MCEGVRVSVCECVLGDVCQGVYVWGGECTVGIYVSECVSVSMCV